MQPLAGKKINPALKKKMYITFESTRFAMVSGLNDMFPGNGVQRGLKYVFSCLVGV